MIKMSLDEVFLTELCLYILVNEKSISQFVGSSEVCDQNADRVSRKDKSCQVCSKKIKVLLAKYEKYGTLSMYDHHVIIYTPF